MIMEGQVVNVGNYLIDQSGKNWPELLSGWVPPLPSGFTVWLVNRFGDVFAVFDDESVHMLDLGTGVLARVADNRADFADKIDLGDNANDWLMIPLVDQCVAAGVVLREDQCYGYKVPPLLGGAYTMENIEPTNLSVHYSLMSDVWRQTKDLPESTKVRLVVKR
jgi:hypothetical protein